MSEPDFDVADQLLKGATDVFGAAEKPEAAAPTIDVKSLHAKIGELTLENDSLSGKAGLSPSALSVR
jgi:transposase